MKKEKFVVDLILTDPPYNISKKNNFTSMNRKGIDFGKWDKNFDQLDWLNDIGSILSKNGSMLIFNDWKNMGAIAKKLEEEGFDVKDLIRWIKPSPMPRNSERRYVTDFELILWATKKGGKWTFNKTTETYHRPEYEATPPLGLKRIHPTQKPEILICDLIITHSNVGDIIFDPFSGSGVVSVSADKLDRYFIASEISDQYYTLSKKRLENNYIKPAFNHLGNKRRIIQELIGNFPKQNIVNFIEPFAGSAIVTSSYKSAKKYWLNDNDKHLSELMEYLLNNDSNYIIENVEKVITKYDLPIEKYKKYDIEYKKLKNDYNKRKEIDKLLTLVLFGFNQQIRFNNEDFFNIPTGKFCWNNYHREKLKIFIDNCKNKKIETSNMDFYSFIYQVKNHIQIKDSLFYFDPPYFLSNATYNKNWTIEQEILLLDSLQTLTNQGYKWCLSNIVESKGKVHELLKEFINKNKKLIKWKIITDVNYHNSNYQRQSRTKKDVEILIWGNYE